MPDYQLSLAEKATFGTLSAIVSTVVLYPLDLTKALIQTQEKVKTRKDHNEALKLEGSTIKNNLSSPSATRFANEASSIAEVLVDEENDQLSQRLELELQDKARINPVYYRNTVDALLKILKQEGVKGWYHGLQASVTSAAVQSFSYFYFYEALKKLYSNSQRNSSKGKIFDELSISILAAALSQFFVTPFNVITTELQTSQFQKNVANSQLIAIEESNIDLRKDSPLLYQYYKVMRNNKQNEDTSLFKKLLGNNELIVTGSKIVKKSGISALWKGLKVSLILTLNPSITYGSYERLKKLIYGDIKYLSAFQSLLLGMISKMIATLITQPLIVSKTVLQKSQDDPRAKQFNSFQQVLCHLWKTDKFKGLWRGLLSQIFKGALGQGLLFLFKDQIELVFLSLINIYRLYTKRI